MSGDGTVLVVDDEQTCREIYRNWLSGVYDVRTASDGHQALAKLDEQVDVVLLDRRMSGPSGERIASVIEERTTDCRVVMVTGVRPDLDIIGMHIDEYLRKPVTGEELRETVERMLARSVYRQEMYVELKRRLEATQDRLNDALLAADGDWTDKFRACTDTGDSGAVA
jgi:DNA-binding NtrC family response regulator